MICGIELYRNIVLDKSTAEKIGIGDVNIGIGVHSGMTRIGIVGESERLSGTVISDTVNLSSRLESLTKQYHTAMLITKDTVDVQVYLLQILRYSTRRNRYVRTHNRR